MSELPLHVRILSRLPGGERRIERHVRARLRASAASSALVAWSNVRSAGKTGCVFEVGPQSIVHAQISYDRSEAAVRIGARTYIGAGAKIVAAESVTIGDDVLISWGVTIVDHDSHSLRFSERQNDVVEWREGRKDWTHVRIGPVMIENKAWLGFDSTVLKGVRIGEGAVVGACSVVTKNVAPWTVVAGNPARVIRQISEDER